MLSQEGGSWGWVGAQTPRVRAPHDACCLSAHLPPPGHDFQDSCSVLDKGVDLNWEAEKELEAAACSGEDFVPPKIMVRNSWGGSGSRDSKSQNSAYL